MSKKRLRMKFYLRKSLVLLYPSLSWNITYNDFKEGTCGHTIILNRMQVEALICCERRTPVFCLCMGRCLRYDSRRKIVNLGHTIRVLRGWDR